MKNQIVAKLLNDIANILEIQEVKWKPRAYRHAAQAIESLTEDVEKVDKEGRLEEIPGVGEHIAVKIHEFLIKGKLKYFEDLKKKMPVDVESLVGIESLGPKTVKLLYKKLKIKKIKDLQKAAKAGKIRKIKGLGPKTEKAILESISFKKSTGKRMLLNVALNNSEQLMKELKKQKEVSAVEIVGSARRGKETIGDLDLLVVTRDAKKTMETIPGLPIVKRILVKGQKKISFKLQDGTHVDIRAFPKEQFGAAMIYFTGSKPHNIALRKIAIKKKLKLNEYGLFNSRGNSIAGKTEKEVYRRLGLPYFPPEMRENTGELGLKKIPSLVNLKDIKGDLQVHTKWSDGDNTIKEMAQTAKRLGYKYIVITDHVGSLRIARGLDEKRLRKQRKEIEKVNSDLSGIKIFQGAEVNILANGKLDMPEKVLADLDIALGSIHSGFSGAAKKLTDRICSAMEDEYIRIIAHPTGRLLNTRPGYSLQFERVVEKAKETGTVLEINAQPNRLDLRDVHVKAAVEAGVKLSIGTDSHSMDNLQFMRFGVLTARRGWARKKDIVNTLSLSQFKKKFKI